MFHKHIIITPKIIFSALSIFILTFNLLLSNTIITKADTLPSFSPTMIMADSTFNSTRVFPTEISVQDYLDSKNSILKNYVDQGKKASYWIFNAANGTTSTMYGVKPQINPGVILAFLEKEQSLISNTIYDTVNDPERKISSAMGYGCPDSTKCDPDYAGLANQLNWGAFQLQYNFNGATQGSPKVAPYITNRDIIIDEYKFKSANAATAAAYRYTPHLYPGQYNLWKILTANGWGSDSSTYTYQQLDNANPRAQNDAFKISVSNPIVPPPAKVRPQLSWCDNYKLGNFQIGTSGNRVTTLQNCLKEANYFNYPGGSTGYYGNYTASKQEEWMSQKDVCRYMYGADFSVGEDSTRVKYLQKCMRADGFFTFPGGDTGFFGPVTQQAYDRWR